jgi:DNA replication factor GINS
VDRRTVRITDDVGEIFGVDQREYDLSTDDVVTLPADNADPLVEQDAAEPLE